jgi:multidrug efflux pump subunit AcrA (membrane-fusion protein)
MRDHPPLRDLAIPPLSAARLLNGADRHDQFSRIVLALAVVLFLVLFLPWQQNVQGKGSVTALRPQDRPQVVPTVIAGRIERWHVAEGQYVTRGTLLVEISEVKEAYLDPNTLLRYREQRDAKQSAVSAKRAKVSALGRQVQALEQSRVFGLAKARAKVALYEAAVSAAVTDSLVADRQLQRNQQLLVEGLKSRAELEAYLTKAQSANAKLVEKRQELAAARVELDGVVAEYEEKIAKATADLNATRAEIGEGMGEVSKLENQVAALEIRNGLYRIVAPQDGYVVRAQRPGIGEQLKEGDPVVTIMPADPQQAVELYVRPMDVPLLRTGRKVRLQFDGWPALQFSGWPSVAVGTFGGQIAAIDLTASTDGSYRILVVPDPDDEPWPRQVRVGSGVLGWAMLDTVRVWFELWRQLNGFPPSVSPGDPAALSPVTGKK